MSLLFRYPGKGLISLLFFLSLISSHLMAQAQWPEIRQETRPWTRWWWMGSSVDEKNLTAAMEQYKAAGLGGLEITPIYGVKGYEDQFIDFLSLQWISMLEYTLREGKRLDLGIDMANASGWPFGGPWVGEEDACKYVAYQTYPLKSGESLQQPVHFQQEPIVRAVSGRLDISELKEPVSANKNMQALALDQVRYPKQLPLQVLMAYSDQGKILNLTEKVDEHGKLTWKAPQGNWTLYALFQGWHGKMVERAGPGGEGNVIDHFSGKSVQHYLQRFDKAFQGHDISGLRAFFNDSYEVDDARGEADWTPALLEEFKNRRGYDLQEHLPALFGQDTEENNTRVLSDYRETISDLLLEKFTRAWHDWAQSKGAIIRNQAHGSPANILDLYAASDIPETEGTDMLRIKFATSAAHVTGKKLVSSESATWLNEHFLSTLADVKKALDRFLLGGVNHIFYHGTAYSPQEAEWPGWLFYAAVHFSPTHPFWHHFGALNHYVARVQSFMQEGKPDNDVLLYFPVYDRYAERGSTLLTHFDGFERYTEDTTASVRTSAQLMLDRGFAFDFISDLQLRQVQLTDGQLQTGGVAYQTILLPACRYMPLETWQKAMELADKGATILVHQNLPADVPGMGHLKERQQEFQQRKDRLHFSQTKTAGVQEAKAGQGRIIMGEDVEALLSYAGIRREAMVDQGLQCIRRSNVQGNAYFIVNGRDKPVDQWLPLQVKATSAVIFDPMMEKTGKAALRQAKNSFPEAYVQLSPGASCILQTYASDIEAPMYPYTKAAGDPVNLSGTWKVTFTEGGPELPAPIATSHLGSWTDFEGEAVKKFSGTATYTLSFPQPKAKADAWILDLGAVRESASVKLNGQTIGTLIGPEYKVLIDKNLMRHDNLLEVEVANLMANRIADMDRRDVQWKKFYNINFPARLKENRNEKGLFDASDWAPKPSGLIGPVKMMPVEYLHVKN